MEDSILKKLKMILILIVIGTICFVGYKVYDGMQTVNFKIKVNDGLQISVDGKEFKTEITRDDLINLRDSYSKALNQLPRRLGSVSSTGSTTNGKMDMFYVDYTGNGSYLTAIKENEVSCFDNGECEDKHFIAFDVFVKSEAPVTLTLTKDSNVLSQIRNGYNNYYNAARVGFIVEGTIAEDNVELLQSLSGGASSKLWEPNYDDNKEKEGILVSYKAVDAEIKNSLSVGQIDGNFNFSKVSPNVYTKVNNSEDNELVDIQAGITKIRIYMWLESLDVDMKPNAKTNRLDFNIELGTK